MDKGFWWKMRGSNKNVTPPVGKGVLVEHEGQSLMAYLDGEGNWRNEIDGNVLRGKVRLKRPEE